MQLKFDSSFALDDFSPVGFRHLGSSMFLPSETLLIRQAKVRMKISRRGMVYFLMPWNMKKWFLVCYQGFCSKFQLKFILKDIGPTTKILKKNWIICSGRRKQRSCIPNIAQFAEVQDLVTTSILWE